jgi:hypothetical protein
MSDSPSSYWRLGESSGTTATDEVGAFNGTHVATPTLGVAGIFAGNAAAAFNGTDEYTNCGGAGNFFTSNQFSLELWVKMTTPIGTTYLLSKANDSLAGQWYLGISGSSAAQPGTVLFRVANGTIRTGKITSAAPDLTSWKHIVATWNAGTFKIYVNAVDQGLSSDGLDTGTVTTLLTSAVDTNIARRGTGGGFALATIDEVAIYPTALSAARIAAHYAAAGY